MIKKLPAGILLILGNHKKYDVFSRFYMLGAKSINCRHI
ncbi:hypothetical protein AIGOOFII_1217 [Methylobacterium marchantiae]|nr:hypothetical protein AIGOOFII_1217 [Methylobacterium marchantiae]